jgi:hypothetical protein
VRRRRLDFIAEFRLAFGLDSRAAENPKLLFGLGFSAMVDHAFTGKADTLVSGGVVQSTSPTAGRSSRRQAGFCNVIWLSITAGFHHRRQSMRHLAMRFSIGCSGLPQGLAGRPAACWKGAED